MNNIICHVNRYIEQVSIYYLKNKCRVLMDKVKNKIKDVFVLINEQSYKLNKKGECHPEIITRLKYIFMAT